MRRRTLFPIIFIALLALASVVSAGGSGGPGEDRTTLRASTSGERNALIHAAIEGPADADPSSPIGLVVLVFGGLIAGLWLAVAALAGLRALREAPAREATELTPRSHRSWREESPAAEWL